MTVLSSPSATAGQNTATLSVTTNEGDWHLYWAVRTSGPYTSGDAAIIKSGSGAAKSGRLSGGVNPTGVNSGEVTGLNSGVTYYAGFVQEYNDTTSYEPLWDYPLIFGPAVLPASYNMQNYAKQNKGEIYGISIKNFMPYNPGTIVCGVSGDLVIGAGTPNETFTFTISGYNSVGKSESIIQVIPVPAVTINYYFVPNVLLGDYFGKQNEKGLRIGNAPDILAIKFGVFDHDIAVVPSPHVDMEEFIDGVSMIIMIFTDLMKEVWLLWDKDTRRFEGHDMHICEYVEEAGFLHRSVPVYVEFQL